MQLKLRTKEGVLKLQFMGEYAYTQLGKIEKNPNFVIDKKTFAREDGNVTYICFISLDDFKVGNEFEEIFIWKGDYFVVTFD